VSFRCGGIEDTIIRTVAARERSLLPASIMPLNYSKWDQLEVSRGLAYLFLF
jgi:hypothetical protein